MRKLQARITICPGISSLSYLAARAGKSWQDAKIVSTHGREADVTACVRREKKGILIVSGRSDLIRIGEELEAAGLSGVELTIGYQLSHREERIWHGTPEVCRTLKDDGLYACLIENPGHRGTLTPGVPDRWFVRGRVPMTKEEIRWLSLCRLGLKSQSVFMISEAEPARLQWRQRCSQNRRGCMPWNMEGTWTDCGKCIACRCEEPFVVKGRHRNVLGNSRCRRTRSSAEAAAGCGRFFWHSGRKIRTCALS